MKLSPLIHQFFDQYLPSIRGVSHQTIKAYRDAFRLFLPFAASFYSIKVKSLRVEHIKMELVVAFLENLQTGRENTVKTRNHRLAALKSFAKMIRFMHPDQQRVVNTILIPAIEHYQIQPSVFKY
jgi:integrase/recombinase XerD